MDIGKMRQQLQSYLAVVNDKKVKALYTMMEGNIKESVIDYTDELKAELDSSYASYKNGKAKMITAAESKKAINKILNG